MTVLGLRDHSGRVFWTLEGLDSAQARRLHDARTGWRYGWSETDANGVRRHGFYAWGEAAPEWVGI